MGWHARKSCAGGLRSPGKQRVSRPLVLEGLIGSSLCWQSSLSVTPLS
jgi:hypothetical protein